MILHVRRLSAILILSVPVLLAACSRNGEQQPPAPAAAAESAAPETVTAEPAPERSPELAGTAWKLVKIQSMDDTEAVPAEDTAYTITFNADGSAAMQVGCNRGHANWDSPAPRQLTLGPLALTRAMCPPGSLHDRFVEELGFVRSYVLEDGHLHLATMADGSIIEFEPLAQ